jgi:tetratricopeptide (TPR) repeat protein
LHLKPAPKWLVILALIMVALSALVLASSSASIQQTTATSDKTQNLFSLFQKANSTVAEIFRQFKTDGKTIPQASLNEYDQALVLAEESKSLLQAGNYSQADSKIVQALQKLKEALRIVYTAIPEQPTETEISFERTVQLKSSINRYYEQLQRIENLTRFAAAVGYNTTALEAKIQTIKSLLDRASNNIDQKRFEAASDNLAEAKTFIDRLVDALNNIAANLKIQRLETYIAQTEVRLDEIRETAISLSNDASLIALNNAETSLDNAKEYLEKQRINETLSELANSKESEEEAVEYLKPAASSSNFPSSASPNAVQVP